MILLSSNQTKLGELAAELNVVIAMDFSETDVMKKISEGILDIKGEIGILITYFRQFWR